LVKNLIHEEREKFIQQWIPDLFSKKYNSVLYVGANKKRQHFLNLFELYYSKITILEIFKENIDFLKTKYTDSKLYSIIHGDVRNIDKSNLGKFDVVFFWHGIDLLPTNDIKPTLEKVEKVTNNLIVLGVPFGRYLKDDTVFDNNPNEDHVSPIYPEFLKELGFETRTLGEPDQLGSSITGWKSVN
jgi:hypothetical protein